MKKDKFLKFFEEEVFFEDCSEIYGQVSFIRDRLRLQLEDSDWDDICFDVYISDNNSGWVYLTCLTTVKELKQLIKLL